MIIFVNNASTDRINRVAEAVETIEDSGYVNGVDYSYYRDSELFTVGDLYGLVTTFDTGVTVMIEDVWGVEELNGYLHNSNGTVDKSYITITSFSDTVGLSKVLESSIGEDFKFTCDYMYKDSMHLIMCFTLQD